MCGSKTAEKETIQNAVEVDQSSGWSLFNLHAPSTGLGVTTTVAVVITIFLLILCYVKCCRGATTVAPIFQANPPTTTFVQDACAHSSAHSRRRGKKRTRSPNSSMSNSPSPRPHRRDRTLRCDPRKREMSDRRRSNSLGAITMDPEMLSVLFQNLQRQYQRQSTPALMPPPMMPTPQMPPPMTPTTQLYPMMTSSPRISNPINSTLASTDLDQSLRPQQQQPMTTTTTTTMNRRELENSPMISFRTQSPTLHRRGLLLDQLERLDQMGRFQDVPPSPISDQGAAAAATADNGPPPPPFSFNNSSNNATNSVFRPGTEDFSAQTPAMINP